MRKILLATTALVAFAGAAQAADAPITVNVGGYVDFRAAMFHESDDAVNMGSGATHRRDGDFETEYRLNIAAEGKAANGIEYGGLVSLWNGADYTNNFANSNTNGNQVHEDQAYVWMSGAWGKVILGDDHGASDLFVYAPTVGEGQIDGTYTDFTDPTTLMKLQPSFIDNTENSTKVTYYTPKVGNANNKIQLGASFAPNFYDQGDDVIKYTPTPTTTSGPNYQDYVKAAAQYTGNFSPVSTVLSATVQTADPASATNGTRLRSFTSYGVGAQAMYAGFTLGGSYVDAGRYGTIENQANTIDQNKDQSVWTAGLKYEFDKIAVAVNGMRGQGYDNMLVNAGNVTIADRVGYVKDFDAIGVGATYTWFPGLTTAADLVFFDQQRDDTARLRTTTLNAPNDGQVLMLSQKITF
jgi:predicted porin